jgi:predicted RNA methylase
MDFLSTATGNTAIFCSINCMNTQHRWRTILLRPGFGCGMQVLQQQLMGFLSTAADNTTMIYSTHNIDTTQPHAAVG